MVKQKYLREGSTEAIIIVKFEVEIMRFALNHTKAEGSRKYETQESSKTHMALFKMKRTYHVSWLLAREGSPCSFKAGWKIHVLHCFLPWREINAAREPH